MIIDVVDRLELLATDLKSVKPAEDIEALSKGTAPANGMAFVLPYREQGEPNEYATGIFRQRVAVQILVAFVIRKQDDVKGGKRVTDFDLFKASIEQALAGWSIAPEDDPFELVAGAPASLGNGVTVYVQTWQTSRYLEKH